MVEFHGIKPPEEKHEVHKKTHGKLDSSMRGRVQVKIDTDKGPAIEVSVYSGVKKGFVRVTKLNDAGADDANRRQVGIAAGAAAEHLCEQYGDTLNPDECAALAVKLFTEGLQRLRLDAMQSVKTDAQ